MNTENIKPIGYLGSIEIKDNGIIAKVNLDNTFRNKMLMELYKIEDKILMLEFKYTTIHDYIKEMKDLGVIETAKALERANKKLLKEIKALKKTLKNLSLIY